MAVPCLWLLYSRGVNFFFRSCSVAPISFPFVYTPVILFTNGTVSSCCFPPYFTNIPQSYNGYGGYGGGGYGGGGGGGWGEDKMSNLGGGLRSVDWASTKLERFEKNFYVEDKRVTAHSDREVEDFKRSKEIKVSELSFLSCFVLLTQG